jgi:hypothetical protein
MGYQSFFDLCPELDRRHVKYDIGSVRDHPLMIRVAVPGERWELEVFDNGSIELERFVSQGVASDQDAPSKLLAHFDED